MKKNKDKRVSIYALCIISFLIIDVLVLLLTIGGIQTAFSIVKSDVPEVFMNRFLLVAVVMTLLIYICTTIFSVFFARVFRVSIGKVVTASKDLAAGKTATKIEKNGNNEIGDIIDQLNIIIENSQEQSKVMDNVANGDLTVTVPLSSEEDVLGNAISKMVDRNRGNLSNISVSASQVLTSSSEVASASEALAQGATEQASAIEQITVSMNDIANKTKANAAEARRAADLMSNAKSEMEAGDAKMKEMMEAMNAINASSENISKIIKVIDDIAFQTNILALNAAVEAARAGDAGKGFAVVAEEVRNLAAKSAQAAAETADLIQNSIAKVNAGSNIAKSTAESLEALDKVVIESNLIVTQISEASDYQATAISQVNSAIGQVSDVVSTNSATSEECAAASEELSNQARRMKELLSVYKLGADKGFDSHVYDGGDSYNNSANENEMIISLGEGFGKY